MEEAILAILILLFIIIFGAIIKMFITLAQTNAFVYELSKPCIQNIQRILQRRKYGTSSNRTRYRYPMERGWRI